MQLGLHLTRFWVDPYAAAGDRERRLAEQRHELGIGLRRLGVAFEAEHQPVFEVALAGFIRARKRGDRRAKIRGATSYSAAYRAPA